MKPDPRNHAPTAQTAEADSPHKDWLDLASKAFRGSTSYVDTNYRKIWEDSLRAFNNQHSTDSKYNQTSYDKRSKIFRPRTRAVIRKNEAAAAAAFFSNMDVVSVQAQDTSNKPEVASAEIMKQLLQYRLTKSIPWYQIVLGGLQDAQTTGVACAHVHWDYQEDEPEIEMSSAVEETPKASDDAEEEYPAQDPNSIPEGTVVAEDGDSLGQPAAAIVAQVNVEVKPNVRVDKPVVELIPIENIRFDPAANWTDPVGTSPYFIHLMPMYVLDVKEKMETGEWHTYGDSVIGNAVESVVNTTRLARNRGDDPMSSDSVSVDDYQIVWVQRHIHRRNNKDWTFYTLSDLAMLSDPVELKQEVFHGKRPYVIGCCILEAHKTMPAPLPLLGKGLQDEINEIANQRIDNVKFVLNKKWFVKRGKEADVAGLVRNVPGGVVMLDDPQNDVREVTWPDVTASSYQEHQGLNQELDELLGNFNPAAMMSQSGANSPARNMAILSNSQGTLTEYLIRTYVETFVQPVLRQIVLLEQEYETDQVVLKIAANRAEVFQKYGIDNVTDQLLNNELTLTVNVGMGATDPAQKLQKFMAAMSAYTGMLQHPVPGIDMLEVGKEIFGNLGYSDGSRFFSSKNPQIDQMQQQMQQMQQQMQQVQKILADKKEANQVKLAIAQSRNVTELQKEKLRQENENKRSLATHFRAIQGQEKEHAHQKDISTQQRMAEGMK